MEHASLADIAGRLRQGELQLQAYLQQLEARMESREPQILAFVPEEGRFERLRRQAEELLELHPDPLTRPPLFGVAIGVKDVFRVDGFPTRAGGRLRPELLAGPEAASVSRLKEAGVLVVGKTASTEFAYFAPAPTRNPVEPDHTPGGSSSGSAAAVAAELCDLALGTQTIGSITRPAAFCGVVGFKGSYNRISKDGVIPLAPSLDHVGLLTRDVAGAELAAQLLCRDWRPQRPQRPPVLAVPEGPYLERASPEGLEHFRAVCSRLADRGYQVKAVQAFADFGEIEARHRLIVAAEAARVHTAWYPRFRELYQPTTAELIEEGRAVSDEALAAALGGREALRGELIELMATYSVDLWLSPAAPGPAPAGLESTGDPVMNLPWTHAGLPTLCLPAGRNVEGLPLGLQVAAGWLGDEELFVWGAELEEAMAP